MKGVDLCDQMIGYYMLNHTSKKRWRRIHVFFYLMMASAHNAYIVAKDTHPETFPDFRTPLRNLLKILLGTQEPERSHQR